MTADHLHADAVAVLSGWVAPSAGQDRLRRDYLDVLDAHPRAMRRDCVPAHLTGSALVLDPVTERVLLLLHAKAGLWLQAGGHCEDGDASLAATALREATEESGIAGLTLGAGGRPVQLDRHAAPCAPGVAEHHLDVQYVALAPAGAVAAISDESHDLGWFGYDDLPEPLGGGVVELIAAARAAL
ncbi:NUDIX hydrolase [Jiangella mangrovi]|uniref:8-oxo-dGTP pyrophosphatase MutT (NUDIX family) n=1 Tax=Jiangella mangrovi TaxID=1524084 RepID=A0A7W9GLE1_9ACTN|nr:NUDIX domain-containing protein [Jiangella mangrovi]MBB5785813.1 8-oxo-dGTP pyrophosphatase MutT (NUDIX family) [Jiangella mangrovi]